jgi:molybdenum cofactor cytidylyltransferase
MSKVKADPPGGDALEAKNLRVAVVVLAAGLSSRMELGPKLLLDLGGEPMIRRTVCNVLAMGPSETVVVTGANAREIEAALEGLEGLPLRCVFNPEFRAGQQGSVICGVSALRASCDAVMVALGDQPLVTAEHLRALVARFAKLRGRSILAPHHGGAPGNPVIFAAKHIPSIAAGKVKVGCRRLIESLPDEIAAEELDSNVYTLDCDTREDYERIRVLFDAAAAGSP